MKRRTLPVTVTLAAATALLLSGCGGGEDETKDNDKIAGAEDGNPTASASPSAPAGGVQRPDMSPPGDVKETFEGWKTGDAMKDAVLADAGKAQTAVTYAVTQGAPNSPALSFYQAGAALAGSKDWVKSIVDAGLTYSGSVRYYNARVSVFDKKSAGVSYCADEGKAFNKNRKSKKVDKVPVTADSYVAYSTHLTLSDKGVWRTTKLTSERGNKACTP